MTDLKNKNDEPALTSLAHGGGCGCKIAPNVLTALLARLPVPTPDPNLLVGTETGDDAAVYRLNDEQAVIATTDFFMPIVDDPFDFGRIAATNALSDVYAMGGQPILALAIVGMPINVLSPHTIGEILRGGQSVCASAGIVVAGGHSIDSVEPIYGLAALGVVDPKLIRRNRDAQAGDCVILGKPLGVGIFSAAYKKQALEAAAYQQLIETTTLLNKAGQALAQLSAVHAMTDVTGFGLLGHAQEVAQASGVSLHLDASRIPFLDSVQALAQAGYVTGASGRNWQSYGHQIRGVASDDLLWRNLLTDPQTSGGLLVTCAPDAAEDVLETFRAHGCGQASVIGEVQAGDAGFVQVR